MYRVQCTLFSVQCTLYSVLCTLYTVHHRATQARNSSAPGQNYPALLYTLKNALNCSALHCTVPTVLNSDQLYYTLPLPQ